jgi:prophage tail gpP-like protein
MASKNRLNYWTPDITYRVELIIDGKSYTQELVRLKIRSSMEIPYQSVDLYLSVDPGDIIQNQLFGQNSITLQILF